MEGLIKGIPLPTSALEAAIQAEARLTVAVSTSRIAGVSRWVGSIELSERSAPGLDLSRHLLEVDQASWGIPESSSSATAPRWRSKSAAAKGCFSPRQPAPARITIFWAAKSLARYARFAAARRLGPGQPERQESSTGMPASWLREHLAGRSVGAVHVYFPDPWWKQRHHKRRVHERGFSDWMCTECWRPAGDCTSGRMSRSTIQRTCESDRHPDPA